MQEGAEEQRLLEEELEQTRSSLSETETHAQALEEQVNDAKKELKTKDRKISSLQVTTSAA